MKRIHFHSDCYFFAGCERMLSNLLNSEFLNANYAVSFSYRYTKRYSQELSNFVELSSIKFFPLYILDPCQFDLGLRGLARVLSKLFKYLATPFLVIYQFFYLLFILFRVKPNILHINNGGYPGALSCRLVVIAGKLLGIKSVIMVINNLPVGYEIFPRKIQYFLDKLVIRWTSLFITSSEVNGQTLFKVLNISPQKTLKIPNGIRIPIVTESVEETKVRLGILNPNTVVVGVVSLFEERKGHKYLIDAIRHLTTVEANLNFIICLEGDPLYASSLIEHSEYCGVSQFVKFIGVEDCIGNFIAAIDLLVLPSIEKEDFPNVVLEAMAFGKGVIASNVGGIAEQVSDRFNGLLVQPKDVIQLSRALQELIKNKHLRNEMGKNASKNFNKNYKVKSAVLAYLELYEKLT